MKILLLTDIPPCENFTAGLVLEKLVRFLPPEDIVLCSVVNPAIVPVIPADLHRIPTLSLQKPREAAVRLLPGWMGSVVSYFFELFQSVRSRCLLLPRIVDFARKNQVEAVWVVLQGQTMVRLARPLSRKLGIPLFTQVWDPFGWWLRDNAIDMATQSRLLAEFDQVILHSQSCATASWAMSINYDARYKVRNIPVIASMASEHLSESATAPHANEDFIIAMAGQFYAQAEWLSLISALDHAHWTIAGRRIRLRVMGARFEMATHSAVNFEYLGWQSQAETIRLLAESDLLYLPYWFSEEFREEASNSFPSKLITYFAAGRPVLCHAPQYASPATYIVEHDAGYLCDSLAVPLVLKALEYAIADKTAYAKYARNGTACFLRDFTLERMEETFLDFLSIDKCELPMNAACKNNEIGVLP